MAKKNFIIAPHISFLGISEPDDIIQRDINSFIRYLSSRCRDISAPSQDNGRILSEKEISDFFDRIIRRVKESINEYNKNRNDTWIYAWLDYYQKIEDLSEYIFDRDFPENAFSNKYKSGSFANPEDRKQINAIIDKIFDRVEIDDIQAILFFEISTFEKDAPLTYIYPGDLDD